MSTRYSQLNIKLRYCIKCDKVFKSKHSENRKCYNCKRNERRNANFYVEDDFRGQLSDQEFIKKYVGEKVWKNY